MATKYRVNDAAVERARKLIDDGAYDDETPWSDAAPSTEDANGYIDEHGYDGYGEWHLGIDTQASEGTKDRFGFPYGDFDQVNRSALIHGKQRASQNDHEQVRKAADDLLAHLDDVHDG